MASIPTFAPRVPRSHGTPTMMMSGTIHFASASEAGVPPRIGNRGPSPGPMNASPLRAALGAVGNGTLNLKTGALQPPDPADLISFRHTFAKRALENGRQITWLSRHLGHSSLKVTTDVYGHWERGERKKEAELMAGVFGV